MVYDRKGAGQKLQLQLALDVFYMNMQLSFDLDPKEVYGRKSLKVSKNEQHWFPCEQILPILT